MFDEYISELARYRGRFPVANLVGDFLKNKDEDSVFLLGHWLSSLDTPTLEDLQTKLDMLLGDDSADHAAEDLIAAVGLLSHAERGYPVELSAEDIRLRLIALFQCGLVEKLSRGGVAKLTGTLSIDPDVAPPVELDARLSQRLTDD